MLGFGDMMLGEEDTNIFRRKNTNTQVAHSKDDLMSELIQHLKMVSKSATQAYSEGDRFEQILQELKKTQGQEYYQNLCNWEDMLGALETLHKTRIEMSKDNRKLFPDKRFKKRRFLNKVSDYKERVQALKKRFELGNKITKEKENNPEYIRDYRDEIFDEFKNEIRRMQKEYKFLKDQYEMLEIARNNAEVEIVEVKAQLKRATENN